ncbi:hypothetical protein E1B28_010901 [Marasmius oreades]|uniref:Uncharacterized protein n=1 Tax=Marasmius oreades TaxID=181124 RepID=A0A9P7RSZ3_9AGAR|nr:uncharacterized protein E1B28_010901 [Marasmius oreades]KAG7089199.1 hypothetical protein E1B28_010901 [Marasmius oreades]
MAPFSFIASAILSLASAFTIRTNPERLSNDKLVLGPDHAGYCHLGSIAGEAVPCPSQKYISLGVITVIMVAVLCLLVLVAMFVWRHRVRVRTEDPLPFSFAVCSASPTKMSPLANRSSKASLTRDTILDLESAEAIQGDKGHSRRIYLSWSERPRLVN